MLIYPLTYLNMRFGLIVGTVRFFAYRFFVKRSVDPIDISLRESEHDRATVIGHLEHHLEQARSFIPLGECSLFAFGIPTSDCKAYNGR